MNTSRREFFTVGLLPWLPLRFFAKVDLSAANDRSGILPLSIGGTGGTDAASARTSLSVYSKADIDAIFSK